MRLPNLLLLVAAVSTGALFSSARVAEEDGTDRELLGLAASCTREDMAKSNFDISFLSEATR
jgi:hypothetical protein